MPRRCALGCPVLGVTCHRFPHPIKCPEIFKAWVEIVGGKLETPDDYAFYYKKKRVCDIHFTDQSRNRNHRLNALAVPTLHLPEGARSGKIVSTPHLDEHTSQKCEEAFKEIQHITGTFEKLCPKRKSENENLIYRGC